MRISPNWPLVLFLHILVGHTNGLTQKLHATNNRSRASSSNKPHQDEYANHSFNYPASLPLDPVLFGRFPTPPLDLLSQSVQHDESPIDAAFYSVDGQAGSARPGQTSAPVESIMLQSLGLQLAQRQVASREKPREQLVELPKKAKTQELATNPISSRPLVVSSLGTRTKGPRFEGLSLTRPKVKKKSKPPEVENIILNRLSPLKLPVAMSTKQIESAGLRPEKVSGKVQSVSAGQIEELLRQLRPLATAESDPDEKDDEDNFVEPEEFEQLKREKRISRVLPTAHLFGGSGVINESLLNMNGDRDSFSDDLSDDRELDQLLGGHHTPSTLRNKQKNLSLDDMIYLKSLFKDFREPHKASDSSNIGKIARRPKKITRIEKTPAKDPVELDQANAIPIELLVDHLMSSSRSASFGIQHDQPEEKASHLNEDDEDDSDDDDRDNNGTLPGDNSLDLSESSPQETIVEAPTEASLNFSSIVNKSDSWIPLDSIYVSRSTERPRARMQANESKRLDKRERKGGLNLVVGNKVLSRMDLIRLIRILNRMASKKEPSSERDASRKLLRFLVKLALEEHRKTKHNSMKPQSDTDDGLSGSNHTKVDEDKDPFWNFFRSILVSPLDSNPSNDSLELLPVSVAKTTEARSNTEIQPTTKLEKLSDDLEQYFDNDFYDDLADRNSSGDRMSIQRKRDLRSRVKRGRGARPGYRLPLPIYSQQELEAADEDDVELDHIRLKSPMARSRRDRGRTRGGISSRRRGQDSIRRPKISGDSDQTEQDPDERDERDEGRDPDESEPDERRPDQTRRLYASESSGRDKDENQDEQDDTERPHGMRGRSKPNVRQPEDSDREDVSSEGEETQPNDQSKVNNNETAPAASEQETGDQSQEERQMKRKRRKRKRKKGRIGADLDDRDEIPAPIVAGRFADQIGPTSYETRNQTRKNEVKDSFRESPEDNLNEIMKPAKKVQKKRSKLSKRDKAKRKDSSGKGRAKKTIKGKETKINSGRRKKKSQLIKKGSKPNVRKGSNEKGGKSPSRKARSSSRRTIRKKKMLTPESYEEPKDAGDQDYYNEGTSYSRICDDNGKCKVTVESSSPKLSKAIETGDKPTIARHIGQWMSEPD